MNYHKSIIAILCGFALSFSAASCVVQQAYASDLGESSSIASAVNIAIDELHFPDQAFRNWLLDSTHLNGIGADAQLSPEERQSVTGLFLRRQGIKSLKGVEYFPNLHMIDIEGNYVEEIDLSANQELLNVYLRNNQIKAIDFSHNTKLEFIEIFDNKLTSIDVSMLPNLKFVHLDYNQLKVIDISHNLKLEDDGFVGNNNPLEKVILPNIAGKSFDSFVISELHDMPGYAVTTPKWYSSEDRAESSLVPISVNYGEKTIAFNGQTLYVKREPNSYTIKFDPQGAEGFMQDQERKYDDGMIELSAQTFHKSGYTFAGWSLAPHGSVAYNDRQQVTNLAGKKSNGESITLYAVWKAQQQSSGYFRSQLSVPEQAIYDELLLQLNKLTDPKDPSGVVVSVADEQVSSLEKIMFAAHRDHPEYFWLDMSKLSWSELGPHRFALAPKISGESYFVDGFTADNLVDYQAKFDQKVGEILSSAPQDPQLAVKYFNSWLAEHNVYNASGLGASNFSRTAASAFLSENSAATGPVCYGYATALKVLLDRAGIENAYIEGFAFNGSNGAFGEQHAWNYVKLDGVWYAVDPTWNDPAQSLASALSTYLLVGFETVTTPQLAGKESFGRNHDASKSPALRLRLSYPALSAQGLSTAANQLSEIVGQPGRVQGFPVEDALHDGDTVKLWSDFDVAEPIVISKEVTVDLNGFKISAAQTPAFRVTETGKLTLVNSSDHLVDLSAKRDVVVVENRGSCTVTPRIRIKAPAALLASPEALKLAGHAYAAQTSSAYTVYEVKQPDPLAPVTLERSQVGGTRQDLLNYVNGVGKPSVAWKFIVLPAQSEIPIPSARIPEYSWSFAALSARALRSSDFLELGRYRLTTSVFGYDLSYEVNVVDTQLEDLRNAYREKLQALQDDFMSKGSGGSYFSSDLARGRDLLQKAFDKLKSLTDETEMKALLVELESQLAAIKPISDYVDSAVREWNARYLESLEGFETRPVDADSLDAAKMLLVDVLQEATLSDIVSQAGSSLNTSQQAAVLRLMADHLKVTGVAAKIERLEKAVQWADDTLRLLAQDKPYTAEMKELLDSQRDAYGSLSAEVKAFIAPRLYSDLEEALKEDAVTPDPVPDPDPALDPDPSPAPDPTPDPAPNPSPDPSAPGDTTGPVAPDSDKPVDKVNGLTGGGEAGNGTDSAAAMGPSATRELSERLMKERYIPRLGETYPWWRLAALSGMAAISAALALSCALARRS